MTGLAYAATVTALFDANINEGEVMNEQDKAAEQVSISADDVFWFEDAFRAWECNDMEGVLDSLNSAVNHFMPEQSAPVTPAAEQQQTGLVPKWAGQFDSYEQWVNKGQSWLKSESHAPAVCIDAAGRRCTIGAHMKRAKDDGTYPVRYFWEMVAATPPAQDAQTDFEKWAANKGFSIALRDDPDSPDTFFSYETEQRWLVWQDSRGPSRQDSGDAEQKLNAERYLWLRDVANDVADRAPIVVMADHQFDVSWRDARLGEDLDAALDAARQPSDSKESP